MDLARPHILHTYTYVKLLKFTCKKLDSIECCVLYKNGAETRLMSICNFKNFLGLGSRTSRKGEGGNEGDSMEGKGGAKGGEGRK